MSRSKTAACPACGEKNRPDALFCRRCTAPVAVASLKDLGGDDNRLCLDALFEVLAGAGEKKKRPSDPELWKAYLSAFWLRPETALVLYAEALAVRGIKTRGPVLDLGCGDGIHAALRKGYRFAPEFDAFQGLDPARRDMYDAWNPRAFRAKVLKHGKKTSFGVDIKPTAIKRAAALRTFEKALRADATRLPLRDACVGAIFSNMLRDLGAPLGPALSECRRVLKDDGVLLISAMTPEYSRNLYFAPAARAAERAGKREAARKLLRLDRGRSVFCQRQLAPEQWKVLLKERGLKLKEVRPILGSRVIRFWDVGLRPFSVPLLEQRKRWVREGRLPAMKTAALATLSSLLSPLAGALDEGTPCMHLLVAEKA